MLNFENIRRKKVEEIVLIVKLISLFFCAIVFFGNKNISSTEELYRQFNAITLSVVSIVLFVIYNVWTISSQRSNYNFKIELKDIIESIFFIVLFSTVIAFTDGYSSQYKMFYLFLIITSTIQFGRSYGLVISAICSGIILVLDLLSVPNNIVNTYFQNDLILAGIFILTAWLLGYYVAIEKNYREQLIDLANKDELTGVYNHRYFQEAINNQVIKAESIAKPVSLLFIDIDYFKKYNDLYGHLEGDKILEQIGRVLKSELKPSNIVARYGGEEFAVIIPNTGEEEAVAIGEGIRKIIENMDFYGQENLPNKNLTISVGVSCYPDKAKNKTELINSADDALYRAKFFNKNRVESYHSILEELKENIEEEHIDLISSIKTLISVINAKDRYTYAHTERVVIYTQLVADKLGLSDEDKQTLKYGAYLHDIGKIQIPMEVLNKKMKLSDEEWNLIKKHPENGAEIIQPVQSLQNVIPLILHHHERYDGKGYPSKLSGEEIPYLTRILSVADSFDAMTSSRPYKNSMGFDNAFEELKKCSGTQFDPDIVNAFVETIEINKDYLNTFKFTKMLSE